MNIFVMVGSGRAVPLSPTVDVAVNDDASEIALSWSDGEGRKNKARVPCATVSRPRSDRDLLVAFSRFLQGGFVNIVERADGADLNGVAGVCIKSDPARGQYLLAGAYRSAFPIKKERDRLLTILCGRGVMKMGSGKDPFTQEVIIAGQRRKLLAISPENLKAL